MTESTKQALSKQHHLIYIPGLHDQHPLRRIDLSCVPFIWRLHGFHAHILFPHWEEGDTFTPKLERIIQKIDELNVKGCLVSLVGQSAGGSAVMNAFIERPDKVVGVVNITGRLHSPGQPSLEEASYGSPAFADSVRRCQSKLPHLTNKQRKRIMTIRPSIDKVVPAESVAVEGATNIVSPVRGHSLGGAYISAVRTGVWMQFLKDLAS